MYLINQHYFLHLECNIERVDIFSRPLLKLVDRLLLVGMLSDEDVEKLLIMICPETWDPGFEKDGKDEHRKGLLSMKMAEGAKLQMCYLLHHLCDIQLRHRVESIIAFSHDFVGELQTDQLRRYIEIKQSDLPSAVAAKKTKEFRCPPREQMNAILCKFKRISGRLTEKLASVYFIVVMLQCCLQINLLKLTQFVIIGR